MHFAVHHRLYHRCTQPNNSFWIKFLSIILQMENFIVRMLQFFCRIQVNGVQPVCIDKANCIECWFKWLHQFHKKDYDLYYIVYLNIKIIMY